MNRGEHAVANVIRHPNTLDFLQRLKECEKRCARRLVFERIGVLFRKALREFQFKITANGFSVII